MKMPILLAGLLLTGTAAPAWGQPPASQPADKSPAASASQPEAPPQADPTRPTDPRLIALLVGGCTESANPGNVQAVPQITRRAFIGVGGRCEALVEITGCGLHTLRLGQSVSLPLPGGGLLTFRVTRLSVEEIELELTSPTTGKLIIR